MDFRAYLSVLRRNLLLILAVTALVMVAVGVLTYRVTPIYQSTSRVYISNPETEASQQYAGGLVAQQRVAAYVEIVESGLLADEVRRELLSGTSDDHLKSHVKASVVSGTSVLEISYDDDSARDAQLIAKTYAAKLVSTAKDLDSSPGDTTSTVKATIIDPATLPSRASSPKPALNLILAAMLGLVLGIAISFLRELLDTTVKKVEDLGDSPAPLLGAIALESAGSRGQVITELGVQAPRVEAFRVLRTNISFIDIDNPHKIFVVTSPIQGEGKTSIAVNLAMSLALAGVRTLIVDGDLRRPRVASLMNLDSSVGVTTVLLGKVELDDAIQKSGLDDLHVLSSGSAPPNAAELLQSKAMHTLLESLRPRYDIVIIDSPPLLPVTDAALLAAQSDGALVVLRYGKTTKEQWNSAVDRLGQVDSASVGVVMNMVPSSKIGVGGTYGSYESTVSGRRRGK